MTLTWPTISAIAALILAVGGIAYKSLLARFQKLWTDDVDTKVKELLGSCRVSCDKNMNVLKTDILKQVDTKFELIRKDIDGLSGILKELKIMMERYQELYIETKIEEARSATVLDSLEQRTTKLEQKANE